MKKFLIIILISSLYIMIFADPPNWNPIQGTQYSMVLMTEVYLNDEVVDDTGENMVAAFGPGGEDDCRGLAVWEEPNPPQHDGFWFMTIVSNFNDEEISFKIYEDASDSVYSCAQIIIFENNTTIGSPENLFLLDVADNYISGTISLVTFNEPGDNVENVIITAGNHSANPDNNGFYQFSIEPGEYDVHVELDGYQSATYSDVEVIGGQTTAGIDVSLVDWQVIEGTEYSMVFMASVLGENEQSISDNGMVKIGAFGPGGETDCRAIATWEPANPPYWDGYWYFTIVSNISNGEDIVFKLFDCYTGDILECIQTINFENNETIGSPENPYELTQGIEQSIDLIQGWNWVSFNVVPQNAVIDSVFNDLGDNVIQVKNQTHSATYYEPPGEWVGDLASINIDFTYLVNMNNAYANFIIEGIPIDLSNNISLSEGWNWIAYFPQESLSLSIALQNILDNVYQIKSQNKSAMYLNPPGNWIGDLSLMEPGKGYKLYMNNNDILTYPETGQFIKNKENFKEHRDDPPDWQPITGTQYSMVIISDVYLDEEIFGGNNDNMLAAFGPGGEDDCRGLAIWEEPNPPEWEGFWYMTAVANVNDEILTFKIYDAETEEIYECNETIVFQDNETIGTPTNPFEFDAGFSSSDNNTIVESITKIKNYPNPFNPETKISFQLNKSGKIELSIYNIKGRKIKTLLKGLKNKGFYEITWDGTDANGKKVASGLYFNKLIFDDKTESLNKMILLK